MVETTAAPMDGRTAGHWAATKVALRADLKAELWAVKRVVSKVDCLVGCWAVLWAAVKEKMRAVRSVVWMEKMMAVP